MDHSDRITNEFATELQARIDVYREESGAVNVLPPEPEDIDGEMSC